MNKKEIDKLFVRYTSLSEAEKKNFLKNEKKELSYCLPPKAGQN